MPIPVYHYTTGDRFLCIVASRAILPATAHVEPPEIPAVWLSSAPIWEPSATKGVIEDGVRRQASLAELIGLCGCRLKLPAELEHEITPVDFTLPGIPELGTVLDGIIKSAKLKMTNTVPLAQLMDGQIAALRHWARGRAREAANRITPARNSRRIAEAN